MENHPIPNLQHIVQSHQDNIAAIRRGLMDRYDETADAHQTLANEIQRMYPNGSHPDRLLKHLKGPLEKRREDLKRMTVKELRQAVNAYENWYHQREALTLNKPQAETYSIVVPTPEPSRQERHHSLGKDRREVLVSRGDRGTHGHAAYTTSRKGRLYGL